MVDIGEFTHDAERVFDASTGNYLYFEFDASRKPIALVREAGLYPTSPPPARVKLPANTIHGKQDDPYDHCLNILLPCGDGNVLVVYTRQSYEDRTLGYVIEVFLRDGLERRGSWTDHTGNREHFHFRLLWLDGAECLRDREGKRTLAVISYKELRIWESARVQIFHYSARSANSFRPIRFMRAYDIQFDYPDELREYVNGSHLQTLYRRGNHPRELILTLHVSVGPSSEAAVAFDLPPAAEDLKGDRYPSDNDAHDWLRVPVRVSYCRPLARGMELKTVFADVTSPHSFDTTLAATVPSTWLQRAEVTNRFPVISFHHTHAAGTPARPIIDERNKTAVESTARATTQAGLESIADLARGVPPRYLATCQLPHVTSAPPAGILGWWNPALKGEGLDQAVIHKAVIGLAPWAPGLALVRWSVSFSPRPPGREMRVTVPVRSGDARVIVFRFPWNTQAFPMLPRDFRAMVRALLLLRLGRQGGVPITAEQLAVYGGRDPTETNPYAELPHELFELVLITLFDKYCYWHGVPTREQLMAGEGNSAPIVLGRAQEEEEAVAAVVPQGSSCCVM